MRKAVVTLLLVAGMLGGVAIADERAAAPEAPTIKRAEAGVFPASWIGRWKGDAATGNAQRSQKFTMELVIAATDKPDRFTWTMVYDGEAGRQERPYTLVIKDAARGVYAIDENQGIVLDASLLDGGLYTHFVVQGYRTVTRTKLERAGTAEEHIAVEMITTVDGDATTTGNAGGVPAVRTWLPVSLQRATLKRVSSDKAPEAAKPAAKVEASTNPEGMPDWKILKTEAYPGKQDDVFFVTPQIGWYVNGAGKIFKTTDGGETWVNKLTKPGTYFRCIAFVDEKVGVAGNIGPGYFPNVTDETVLYRTEDGGETWTPVTAIDGPKVVGLCALEVLKEEYVNAGVLDTRTRIIGVGRVGGPVAMLTSDDLGKTWQQTPIADHAAMAFDVHFFDRNHGVIAAASDTNVAESNALIITTADGGKTWTKAYQSSRPYELTWKIAFPSRKVGYVTIQSYNPDKAASQRFVAKTTDGGATWEEIPLIDKHSVRQFGVAFVDELRGWIGAVPGGYQTIDGGATWSPVKFGNAVNKIRLLKTPSGTEAFAIGTQVARASIPAAKADAPAPSPAK